MRVPSWLKDEYVAFEIGSQSALGNQLEFPWHRLEGPEGRYVFRCHTDHFV